MHASVKRLARSSAGSWTQRDDLDRSQLVGEAGFEPATLPIKWPLVSCRITVQLMALPELEDAANLLASQVSHERA
jgi:hypothetical protein